MGYFWIVIVVVLAHINYWLWTYWCLNNIMRVTFLLFGSTSERIIQLQNHHLLWIIFIFTFIFDNPRWILIFIVNYWSLRIQIVRWTNCIQRTCTLPHHHIILVIIYEKLMIIWKYFREFGYPFVVIVTGGW